jgi:hypothetical protein
MSPKRATFIMIVAVLVGLLGTGTIGAGLGLLARGRQDTTLARRAPRGREVSSAPITARVPAVTSSAFSNEALWSSYNDWEPNVATAPGSSYVYELTTRYSTKFCSSGQGHCIVFRASSDGGATWGADQIICPCRSAQNDPVMKVAADGTIYQVHMNGYAVVFQKSSDHGSTWSVPIDFKALSGLSFTDKPWIAISPSGQDVYVAFNSTGSYIAASHNYGASFSAPIKTNSDALYWFAEGGAVAPNGNIYFSESAEQNSKTPTGPIKLAVISSTNGGASWTTTFFDTSQQQPACTVRSCPADFFGAQAAIAVDAAGTIMVAYVKNATAAAPMNMLERTSTDGINWGAPVTLGSGGATIGADFPAVAAGPTAGAFSIAWMDDRNGSSAFNVWYRSTTSSGGSWGTTIRLSNLGSGAPYKSSAGFAFTYGDYFSMSVNSSGTAYVIWGEGPDYVGPGGTWSASGS